MSTTTRQTSLFAAQDWKKVYETFRDADFQSYDFETLRRSMIDYLRLYYPEDFNDFIESSEYIALVDLIAFLGQSLAFRTDLNARENFLDTAERRSSILKLARLISYSPKRSIAASGLLKIDSLTTTESLFDSNGVNLANLVISWNDSTNNNWSEQFSIILNAALVNSQVVGNPGNTQTINGVETQEYSINITPGLVATFPFTASVNGSSTNFEIVSSTSAGQPYIYEVDPSPTGKFNLLYRNDNLGNGSNNTGYFMYFTQGTLNSIDFSLPDSLPNRVLTIGYNNINNNDVWLYSVNSSGAAVDLWKSIPAVAGINVIYNKSSERNLYQINTGTNDQIDLVFGDGSFANIPQGAFRSYFRVSNGLSYKITPEDMQGVSIDVSYVSRIGRVETITLRGSLKYTVTNSAVRESIDDIRQKAPQQYYTQGRMITGEDYNIIPYTTFSDILKAKAINRTSSGVSRFLDVIDTSGKYSSTNVFAEDGYIYRNEDVQSEIFNFLSTSSIQQIVQGDLLNIINSQEMVQYYYAKFTRYDSPNTNWNLSSLSTNGSTGYFYSTVVDPVTFQPRNQVLQLGYVTSTSTKHIRAGASIRFSAPTGYAFTTQNQLILIASATGITKPYIYATVMQVIGDGTNGGIGVFTNGQGTVTLNQKVPTKAIVDYIIPVFNNNLPTETITAIVAKIVALNSFGLRYDIASESWLFVAEQDINVTDDFSLSTGVGDTSGQAKDSSWLIRFKYSNTVGYTIYYRNLEYVFGSVLETRFYFDNQVKIYDPSTGTVIRDQINILKINTQPDTSSPLGVDYQWNVYKNIVDTDGYQDQSNILLTFTDTNNDGIPDNPDLFDSVVAPTIDPTTKFVFFQQQIDQNNFIVSVPVDYSTVETQYATEALIESHLSQYFVGQVFYATDEGNFYEIIDNQGTNELVLSTSYIAKVGRSNLYFQYRHNSPGYRRIDPTPNNVIDMYILTKAYQSDYFSWIQDTTNTIVEPSPPTSDDLELKYGTLNDSKAISDTLIFNSAVFKPLFGSKSDLSLQATFKVVKNQSLNISDNDIKTSVIAAINDFFAIDNWDFGETFYFSELSAYLHAALSPNVSSIIIVPVNTTAIFGSLYQINAEANEIITSSATVENVEIISAITAAQINANLAQVNTSLVIGNV